MLDNPYPAQSRSVHFPGTLSWPWHGWKRCALALSFLSLFLLSPWLIYIWGDTYVDLGHLHARQSVPCPSTFGPLPWYSFLALAWLEEMCFGSELHMHKHVYILRRLAWSRNPGMWEGGLWPERHTVADVAIWVQARAGLGMRDNHASAQKGATGPSQRALTLLVRQWRCCINAAPPFCELLLFPFQLAENCG